MATQVSAGIPELQQEGPERVAEDSSIQSPSPYCSQCGQIIQDDRRASSLQESHDFLQNSNRLLAKKVASLEHRLKEFACLVTSNRDEGIEGDHVQETIENQISEFQNQLCQLLKDNEALQQRLLDADKDRTTLRSNIQKASANWFERKARLSETESQEEVKESSQATGLSLPSGAHDVMQDMNELKTDLNYKNEQLGMSILREAELTKRVKDYEKVIDDQEIIIHGMKDQLDTYFNDNQRMSCQLGELNRLFEELEKINGATVNDPMASAVLPVTIQDLPTESDYDQMSKSISKTYIKLKDLIYEKKSLVTEIERLKTLNVELQNRVSQQELRLLNVSDAIRSTWLVVSNLQDQHAKLHTTESILRYELKEKREILQKLRKELEWSREQWHIIRQKNSESEEEWCNLRKELDERMRMRKEKLGLGLPDEVEGAAALEKQGEYEFEPPVDLLLDLGFEYGCIDPDDDASMGTIALLQGENIHSERLHNLEEQSSFLYQKLMSSTARSLALAARLTSLHEHYRSLSDDEGSDSEADEEEEEEEEENYYEEEDADMNLAMYESIADSPDSESYDTAYVSEGDGSTGENAEGGADLSTATAIEAPEEEASEDLSRRLINFLPKKIEILREDNRRLREKYQSLKEEKDVTETAFNSTLEAERRQRRQLEDQLMHLGQCVDELKLEKGEKVKRLSEEDSGSSTGQEDSIHQLEGELQVSRREPNETDILLLQYLRQDEEEEVTSEEVKNSHEVDPEGASPPSTSFNDSESVSDGDEQRADSGQATQEASTSEPTENPAEELSPSTSTEGLSSGTCQDSLSNTESDVGNGSQKPRRINPYRLQITRQHRIKQVKLGCQESIFVPVTLEAFQAFLWILFSDRMLDDVYFEVTFCRRGIPHVDQTEDSAEGTSTVLVRRTPVTLFEGSIQGRIVAKEAGVFSLCVSNECRDSCPVFLELRLELPT